ncbi:MAG: ABC transporter permease [Clostridia bacterium]|nr:ABC transporter permease [Clostridia bacterium]
MLIKRNTRLFFKDLGMFFSSLCTPIILLVLYVTFLANVYESTFTSQLGDIVLDEKLVGGLVGGQLFSSLLAVSCVTVAFCSNLLMVQDKVTGARRDLMIAPVKRSSLAVAYYASTLIVTLLVALVAMVACFIYLAVVGWWLSFTDVLLLFLDVILLVMFGTALSSIVNYFLTTQGQISAVGTIVSSGYGFICGAYMPISGFSEWLRDVISFLPGTYGTSLLRNHALGGVFRQMEAEGIPAPLIEAIRDSTDCNVYFFDSCVAPWVMYLVLGLSCLLLFFAFILIHRLDRRKY